VHKNILYSIRESTSLTQAFFISTVPDFFKKRGMIFLYFLMYTIVGLGNPTEEYEWTRHNAGRLAVSSFAKKKDFPEWKAGKQLKMLLTKGRVGEKGKLVVTLVLPNLFMNKSGAVVKPLIKTKKEMEHLVVVHDDIDLPLGKLKIVFGRGSGGHKGVESVARALGTKNFARLRIGVAPATQSGKIKKPHGEDAVQNFLLGEFTKREKEELQKKIFKKTNEALEMMVLDGIDAAQNVVNGW
jgi:peptidyl-tRNA hydrolase, PTH1 family